MTYLWHIYHVIIGFRTNADSDCLLIVNKIEVCQTYETQWKKTRDPKQYKCIKLKYEDKYYCNKNVTKDQSLGSLWYL